MRKFICLILACMVVLSVMAGCTEENGTIALKVGEYDLTTADLSYFYMDKIVEYRQAIYNKYYGLMGNYWTSMMGFDPGKPLNAQARDEKQTWADYFMDIAINAARDVYVLYGEAQKANFSMNETDRDSIDRMIDSATSYAAYYGYENLDGYLQMWYGPTANEASYRRYYEACTTAYSYMDHYSNSIDLDMEDYRAYDREHYDDFSVVSFDYYSIQYKKYLGEGVKDEAGSTTWTEEEIQTAREALATDMDTLRNAGITTLKEFDAALQSLDVNKVEDGKMKVTAMVVEKASFGGLSLTPEGKQWLKDTARVAGQFGVFPTYSYEEHPDKEHQHGDDCGCEKKLDSCAFILFQERDDQLAPLVNVRHILVQFKNGITGADGKVTYTPMDKLVAKDEAEKLLQQWKDGEATEGSFAALANAESDDLGGKVTDGGLCERVHAGQMADNFDAWCFDLSRQPGDTGIVETEYGYHVMYFCSVDEMTYRDKLIDHALRTKATDVWYDALVKDTVFEIKDLSEMNYALKLGS